MDLSDIVEHLRVHAPVFGGRVAGAAEYSMGVADQTWMPFPAAYVVPEDEEADDNDAIAGALEQGVRLRFGVVVGFDNRADRRGQSVTELYRPTRAALFRALLNWRPPVPGDDVLRRRGGLYYVEGALQGMDRARLFYKWTFGLDTIITDADGWQETLPPLDSVQVTATAGTGAPTILATFDTSP